MCFIDYIGYTCGHASLPVLRPCPLTTASHTFPTCTRRADKPFLAGEMCAACQKVIHSRATQIEEFEHRFMHERGVCGCDTVFPYLIRPRFIGRDHMVALAAADAEDESTTSAALPPLLLETDVGGSAAMSVRLPSLFAAEWVADHRLRHEAGLCRCHVDFRTYQQVIEEEETFAEAGGEEEQTDWVGEGGTNVSAEGDTEDIVNCNDSVSHLLLVQADSRRTVSSSPPRWRRPQSDEDGDQTVGIRGDIRNRHAAAVLGRSRSEHRNPALFFGSLDGVVEQLQKGVAVADKQSGPSSDCNTGGDEGRLIQGTTMQGASEEEEAAALPPPTTDAWFPRGDDMRSVDNYKGDGTSGTGVRFAGAIFAEVPAYLPITGPFLVQPSPYGVHGREHPLMDGVLWRIRPASESGDLDNAEADDGMDARPWRSAVAASNAEKANSISRALLELPGRQAHLAYARGPLVGFPIGAGPEGVSHAIPWERRPPCWWRS